MPGPSSSSSSPAPRQVPDVLSALAAQQEELAGLVDGLDAAGLTTPSRCPGWSVADVLLHLAQTNEVAVASVTGDFGPFLGRTTADLVVKGTVDDWAGAFVAAERDDPLVVRARWASSVDAQAAAFAAADLDARVPWVVGDMAARSLATTRLSESWIHTVDVGVGLGVEVPPTDRLWHVARLVWRTVPYALAQGGHRPAGDVRFVLDAPDGDRWTFGEEGASTTITGAAVDLCTVAGQRAPAAATGLRGVGPDADAVLRLARTFA
ncbi:maleylpyruvate isomerase family mycothiol-dependent enzyme [Iamia sp. SCSIO 61187]|uniref:maleylpyruvate isomerase family mycothiol-dependent enzyme n=1 Tax=Iamia sp. SCSIO 61187 TaxID=2722752 RepID=UPI001C630B47|nr:maleylpyruvate isomerase family mycothiol-dependent enzyme [Iamia sp. SCSIO 61187]QYG91908.1 maleylpyruvate isomerase family mycothiol-dependent enzyme [Iamia sp. SCSIO 61187]